MVNILIFLIFKIFRTEKKLYWIFSICECTHFLFIRNIYHVFLSLKILLSIYVHSLYVNPSFALKIHMIDYNAFCILYTKCLFCLVV